MAVLQVAAVHIIAVAVLIKNKLKMMKRKVACKERPFLREPFDMRIIEYRKTRCY